MIDANDPPDKIETNGAIRYFQDLGIDLEDVGVFVLGEFLKAPTMGEFLRSGFVEGWRSRK
jgi:DCN1-like protein 1/2